MTISIEWLVSDRVILSTLVGKVTLKEVQSWRENRKYMVEMGTPLVHHINDIRELDRDNLKSDVLEKLRHTMPHNVQMGCEVEVTLESLPLAVADAQTFSTIDDALDFLSQEDASLLQEINQTV